MSLCPLDDRYSKRVAPIANIFCPQQLTGKRLLVMQKWLNFILKMRGIPEVEMVHFPTQKDLEEVHREIERLEFKVTRHDINACIKFLEKMYIENGRLDVLPFIHFGLTSHDVNSIAYCKMLESGAHKIFEKSAEITAAVFNFGAVSPSSMLAFTHGQPATPTTFDRVMKVFCERLDNQTKPEKARVKCKFGGATGGLNALHFVEPDKNWRKLINDFIRDEFHLKCNQHTTQIDHYDGHAELFDRMKRICTILVNFVQDIWQYIHIGYIIQKPVAGEVGSSTMPHKINPIQMELAHGNLLMASSLFEVLSRELPVSKLQRDLHDSTMMRNVGMPFGYLYLAMDSILEGLKRYHVCREKMSQDLDTNWEVLAEAVQTELRHEGNPDAYNLLKEETRNNEGMCGQQYADMIHRLPLNPEGREKLLKLTPETYTPGKMRSESEMNE